MRPAQPWPAGRRGADGDDRVYVSSWGDFRDDLDRFLDLVAAERPTLPVFLAGVSMGGILVTNYAAHRPEGLRGVVALAPALGKTGGSRLLLAVLPLLSRAVPALPIDPKLDLSRLTRDAALQRAYVADPLYQTRVTPRLAAQLLGDKTYRSYEGAYHNLLVETNREEIYDDIAAWIRARA